MAKMYIANCTVQRQDFQYVLPETNGRARKQTIGIGQQIQVSGDLNPLQIESIISQHAKYGMRHIDELRSVREFTGLVYSLDRPVDMNKHVPVALAINNQVLEERGREIRQNAAIAANNATEDRLRGQTPLTLKELELSIVEEDGKGHDNSGFAEGIRVSREGEPHKPTPVPKGRRKAA